MDETWMGEGGEKAEGEVTDKNAREREGEEIQLTIKPRLETNNGYLKPCAALRGGIWRLAHQ